MEDSSTFHKLVDRIYAAAIEPERYTELVEAWLQQTSDLHDADSLNAALQAHFHRAADLVVDSQSVHRGVVEDDHLQDLLNNSATAELIVSTDGTFRAMNEAARTAYGIFPGDPIEVMPIDEESAGLLKQSLQDAARSDNEHLLRLNRTNGDGPLLVALSEFERNGRHLALLRCNDFKWSDELDTILTKAFELTTAEIDIFKLAVEKMDVSEIAEARSSALTTVRSQLRAIYEKTGTHGQVELVRLALGLATSQSALAGTDIAPGKQPSMQRHLLPERNMASRPRQRATYRLPSGRVLDTGQFGAPNGRAVLLIHEDLLDDTISEAAQQAFEQAGLTLLSCNRPGYGKSEPYPQDASTVSQYAEDLAIWLDDTVGERDLVIAARGVGLFYAIQLVQRRPSSIKGVLGISPGLPYASGNDFDGLPYMCRFILSATLETPIGVDFATRAMIGYFNVIGVRRFAKALFGNSPHDLDLLEDADIYQVVTSSVDTMTAQGNKGFAADYRTLNRDWTDDILSCPVPIQLLMGESDTASRQKRLHRLQAIAPAIGVDMIEGVGGLLFYSRYDLIIDAIAAMFDN